MNKLTKLFIVVLAALSFGANAQQHDLKINISNAFVYELNFNYEYILSPYATIGGMVGYAYDFPGLQDPNKYVYFGPELRYYTNPKNGADGFFIGVYSRYKNGSADVSIEETGVDDNGNYLYNYQQINSDYSKVCMGLTLGAKWATSTGFIYGVFGGLGRNLYANYSEDGFVSHENLFIDNSYRKTMYSDGNDSQYWDFRIGFNVGWRFGR